MNDSASNPDVVSVMLPTRGRFRKVIDSIESLNETASKPGFVEYILGLDADDQETIEGLKKYRLKSGTLKLLVSRKRFGYHGLQHYWNAMAKEVAGCFVICWNDDAIMTSDGWDDHIRRLAGLFVVLNPQVKNQLDYSEKFTLFPIIPRQWLTSIDRLVPHPGIDSWLDIVSKELGILINSPSIIIEHRRPGDFDVSEDQTSIDVNHSKRSHSVFGPEREKAELPLLVQYIKILTQAVARNYGSVENLKLVIKGAMMASSHYRPCTHAHGYPYKIDLDW